MVAKHASIPEKMYFRIGEAADLVGVKPYVLRYWETEFSAIRPEKSKSGQRVYRRDDVILIQLIQHLLYEERLTLEGARKRLKELRKAGDLKGVLGALEKAAPKAEGSNEIPQDRARAIAAVAQDLFALSRRPVDEIFSFTRSTLMPARSVTETESDLTREEQNLDSFKRDANGSVF